MSVIFNISKINLNKKINMVPKSLIENLLNKEVYIYIKHGNREFGGIIQSIIDDEVVMLKDKDNNLVYVLISEINVIIECR